MAKLYDLAVVAGTYTDRTGQEKKRWKTIGSVLETRDGGKVILIDRTFNPAGVPVEPGRDQIMVSMFAPKEPTSGAMPHSPAAAAAPYTDIESDIPFAPISRKMGMMI